MLILALVAALVSIAAAAPGDLDPSFGIGGKVTTDFGSSDQGDSAVLQSNGKIVVGGSTGPSGTAAADFALARYTSNGELDPIFDGDGKVTTHIGVADSVSSLVLQADAKIIAAGGSTFGFNMRDFVLLRFTQDGSLDPTFDGDGRVTTDFGFFDGAADVVIGADGKIVAVGTTSDQGSGQSDIALARYQPDGSLDTSFGVGGKVTLDFATDSGSAVALQADGRIIVAGSANYSPAVLNMDFVVARYNSDGSLDPSFGGDGTVTIDFGPEDLARELALQSDGKILVVGRADPDGGGDMQADFALARLNSDGSLDTMGLDPYVDAPFGTGGKVTTDFGASDELFAVGIETGGRIVGAGWSVNPQGDPPDGSFALARYNVNGSLDSTFGAMGKVITDYTSGSDRASDVLVQQNGEIVATGVSASGPAADFALARYLVRGCCVVEGAPPGGTPASGPRPVITPGRPVPLPPSPGE